MNMLEYLIGVEDEEDKGLYAGIVGEEEEGWNFLASWLTARCHLRKCES